MRSSCLTLYFCSFDIIHINIMQKKSIYLPTRAGPSGCSVPSRVIYRCRSSTTPTGADAGIPSPGDANFTIHEYTPLMDSSDMTPEDGSILLKILKRTMTTMMVLSFARHRHDGVYRLCAVVHARKFGKPVIVTGSQIPLAELRSDDKLIC